MDSTPTPTPTSFDPAATAANVALSNYYLAILLVVASVIVIVLALGFAYVYHAKALSILELAVKRGATPTGSDEGSYGSLAGSDPELKGPKSGDVSEELVFAVKNLPADASVKWTADGADPAEEDAPVFSTKFAKAGNHIVMATITAQNGTEAPLKMVVTVGAASAATPVVIPFVLKNWGRLVVILFGAGIVTALMATRILSAEAGVGILGVLLGVGATNAGSGGSSSGGAGAGETVKKGEGEGGG